MAADFLGTECKARAFDGWALHAVLQLDMHAPGILRRVLCTSSRLRRQAVFLALSYIQPGPFGGLKDRLQPLAGSPDSWNANPQAEIAFILMTRRVKDIVQALFGPVEGLVGALSRLGDDPLPPLKYRYLVDILRRPALKDRAKVLRQLEVITPSALTALKLIDPAFLHPDIVRRFDAFHTVTNFNSTVDLIRRVVPGATDEELLSTFKAARATRGGTAAWAEKWLLKSVFETLPELPHDDELVVLRTGEEMTDAAKRFSNCLVSKIPEVAVGRASYLEYKPTPAIIELASMSDGPHVRWALEQVYAPNNGNVSPGLALEVLHKLKGTGILLPARMSHGARYNGAAKLLRIFDFDPDLGALERDEAEDAEQVGGERLPDEWEAA